MFNTASRKMLQSVKTFWARNSRRILGPKDGFNTLEAIALSVVVVGAVVVLGNFLKGDDGFVSLGKMLIKKVSDLLSIGS